MGKPSNSRIACEELYLQRCSIPSDINELLPTLRAFASECDSVTEFGVRKGNSTWAFAVSGIKRLRCYDVRECDVADSVGIHAEGLGLDFKFFKADTLSPAVAASVAVEPPDLLFIDTLHTYDQLREELALHGEKARKFIVIHDTLTFGGVGEDKKSPGINRAIEEWLGANPHWIPWYSITKNNGLDVLARKS